MGKAVVDLLERLEGFLPTHGNSPVSKPARDPVQDRRGYLVSISGIGKEKSSVDLVVGFKDIEENTHFLFLGRRKPPRDGEPFKQLNSGEPARHPNWFSRRLVSFSRNQNTLSYRPKLAEE